MQRLLAREKESDARDDDNMFAFTQRIFFFKDKTLPVIKALDDMGNVGVVSSILVLICVGSTIERLIPMIFPKLL